MLKTTKTINITATSFVGEKQAVYMSASLSTDGSATGNIVKNIIDQELYETNKVEIRKDMIDFEQQVYAEQDKLSIK